jgi:ubiquinone/menaquinone biosynthesis C-methylase UbiE
MTHTNPRSTSWQKVGKWYDETVGEQGHYYHQTVIIPGILKLLNLASDSSVLDLACGQGILSRHLPKEVAYVGIDLSSALIRTARRYQPNSQHRFVVGDISQELPIDQKDFSHAALILALQNLEEPLKAFKNAHKHLQSMGQFVIVLNHPCFRIPRQSSWKIDQENKIQYRRIDRYLSTMKIPIQMHPGHGKESLETWSFHYPLSLISQWLHEAGFFIQQIEEWCSNKVSEGKAAKMENRSRAEIPLFMTILAVKKSSLL